ncbi:MAG: hypothetical protein ACLP51_10625 [Syntrophobacteraceae bacterium]
MNKDYIRKFILPPGLMLSLALIGLMLLSAILYYRAGKIQRFMEPALAISQPKIKFTQSINKLLSQEFGTKDIKGVKFRAGSILVDQSLFFEGSRHSERFDPAVLNKLSRVFLSALSNEDTREEISLIMVSFRYPLGQDPDLNRVSSLQSQQKAWLLLNSLYAAEPQLENKYGVYFVAAALPVNRSVRENNWIEFRIVSTEHLHIEVLQKLEKYMR